MQLPDDDVWLTIKEAVNYVANQLDCTTGEATTFIARRAGAGMLKCHAKRIIKDEKSQPFIDDLDDPIISKWDVSDCEVPNRFWVVWNSDVNAYGDWNCGDFDVNRYWESDEHECWKLFGVYFSRAQIVGQFRPTSSAPIENRPQLPSLNDDTLELLPSSLRAGSAVGRTPTYSHGEVVTRTVIGLLGLPADQRNRLTKTAIASELEKQYGAVDRRSPSAETMEPYAKGVLRALKKHWADDL
jgi:hypothetical protein